jgi:hypothetical protein
VYRCIKEINGLLKVGAIFRYKVPIIDLHLDHFEFIKESYTLKGSFHEMLRQLIIIRKKYRDLSV